MSKSLRQFNKFVKEQIAQSKAERPPPAGTPESTAGGTKVGGKGFSAKDDDGDEVDVLSGDAQVGPDGSASGKGAIAKAKTKDDALTGTVGEIEIAPGKANATGAKVEFDAAKTGVLPQGLVAKADVSAGTLSAEKRVFDDGIAVGLQANSVGGSLTLGTSGTKKADGSDSDRDQTVRFGLSEGPGFAGRIHFGDEDKDGNPEIGVGADFGVVSFDVKTEDPLRTAVALANVGNPLSSLAGTLTDDGSNMTKDALGAVGLPKDTLKQGVDIFKKIVGLPPGAPTPPGPGSGDPGNPPPPPGPPPVHPDLEHADPVHGGDPEHQCPPPPECGDPASKYPGSPEGGETYGGNTAPEYSAPPVSGGAAPECAAPPPECAAPPVSSGPAPECAGPPVSSGPAPVCAAPPPECVPPPEGGA